jgi:hypothetical protein
MIIVSSWIILNNYRQFLYKFCTLNSFQVWILNSAVCSDVRGTNLSDTDNSCARAAHWNFIRYEYWTLQFVVTWYALTFQTQQRYRIIGHDHCMLTVCVYTFNIILSKAKLPSSQAVHFSHMAKHLVSVSYQCNVLSECCLLLKMVMKRVVMSKLWLWIAFSSTNIFWLIGIYCIIITSHIWVMF